MSQRPTSEWQRVLPLSTVSGSAWRVSLLPCGPVASLAGTFPAQCMAYASFTRSQGASDEWSLVRCRLRLFTDATSERITPAEHVISSENLRGGTVFGCGVVSHRPHFLRCVCVGWCWCWCWCCCCFFFSVLMRFAHGVLLFLFFFSFFSLFLFLVSSLFLFFFLTLFQHHS